MVRQPHHGHRIADMTCAMCSSLFLTAFSSGQAQRARADSLHLDAYPLKEASA
jgi:hypothetical protein